MTPHKLFTHLWLLALLALPFQAQSQTRVVTVDPATVVLTPPVTNLFTANSNILNNAVGNITGAKVANETLTGANVTDGSIGSSELSTGLSITDPVLVGAGSAESLSYQYIVALPSNEGTIGSGGTLTLSNYSTYALTNTGDYTISLPSTTAAGYYIVEGISTSAVDPAVITLPNGAVRLASGTSTLITNLTIRAGSSITYVIGLSVTNSTGVAAGVSYVDAEGDVFSQSIAANQVSFSPSGSLASTDVQGAISELDIEKAAVSSLATVATTGQYADLLGEPPTSSLLSVYAAGTAYQLTVTPALLNFGTTDPSLPITVTGFYRVVGRVNLKYNAATFASPSVVTLSIRNPNGNQVANSSTDLTTLTSTTNLSTFAVVMLPVVGYSAGSTTNSLELWGSIDVLPSAGSLDAVEASLHVERIETFSVVDATAPLLVSATIETNGTDLTLVLNEAVNIGSGGNGGFVITPSGGASTLTYASGSGSTTLTYNLSRTIATNETATLDYTQPGNGVEDFSGNDLASFSGTNVVNNSWNTGFTPNTIGTDGSDYMTLSSAPAGISDSSDFTASMWIDMTGSDATNQDFVWFQSSHFFIRRTTTNTFHIRGQTTGGTTILEAATSVTKVAADGWFHLYITVDLSNASNRHIYFDGVEDASVTWATYTNNNIDLATSLNRIGAGSSGLQSIRASMCEFYLSDRYLDNPAAFGAGGTPVSIGANGQDPDSIAPGFYFSLVGGGSSWVNDSSGNGNNFTLTGAFSTPSPP